MDHGERGDGRFGRREWLGRGLAGLAAGLVAPTLLGAAARAVAQQRVCATTTVDIEGPYYRAGAPMRSDLVDPRMDGERLWIRGRVLGPDCATPLAGALLDLWSADAHGHYDNDGARDLHGAMFLRGRVRTGTDGTFVIRTLLPGHYLNGAQYRPAHLHFKVGAPGRRGLTTQLYFPGDPYNAADPFFHPSRLVQLGTQRGDRAAHFDFVLR